MSKSRMLTDNEVKKIEEDTLQFKAFAETLEEILSTSQTPITLGVYGKWGSGKTSLMRLTEDILKRKNKKGEKEIKTVWFDAWKFDKAYDLRVALIHTILKEIEKDERANKSVKTEAKELLKRVNWLGLGKTAVSFGTPLLTPYLSFLPLLSQLLSKDKNAPDLSNLNHEGIPKEPIEGKTLDLIGDFEDEFSSLTKEYVGKDGRLVVFIDDLDRCIPEKTIDILEAIKLFLNVPLSVFVIGADREVIVNGIKQKYGEESVDWGRNYLDKIVQIPFRLPPLRKDVITEHFIQGLDISKEIKGYAPILAEVGDNPRTIKRLLNNFELQRILADKRGLNVDKKVLAKLAVLEFRWSKFHSCLIDIYSDSGGKLNLIEIAKYDEAERDKKLEELKGIKQYYNDQNLMGFLKKEPLLFDVNLDPYVYLARTTKEIDAEKDATSYFNLGYASHEKGDYDKAIEYYTKVIELDPEYVDAYNNRGNAYDGKGEYDRAIEDYSEIIKLAPTYFPAYLNRGSVYNAKGEHDRAIEDYSEIINYLNRGNVYDAKGEFDSTIENYSEIILTPTYFLAYFNRGNVYADKGEYDRAIEDFNKAIELDHNDELAYTNRGRAYYAKGEYDRAIKDFIEAINNEAIKLELDPNDALAYDNLEDLLKYLNEHKELIPEKWDLSPIEQAIKGSDLEKDKKDSILSLLKSLETL